MRRRRLNSGYSFNTDQRRTRAGTIPLMKLYLERSLGLFMPDIASPSTIEAGQLLLWYSADQETLYVNGNTVSSMTNFGTGNNATPFTTGPAYLTNIINGLPAYRFNSSATRTTASYSLSDWTIFVVFKNISGTDQFERLLDHDYIHGFWLGRQESIASSFGGGVMESAPPYGRYVTATDGSWNIIGNQRSGSTHNIWNNGSWISRSTGTVTTSATSSSPIGIGGWNNNSSQPAINVDIAEVVLYKIALTDNNREKIEGYLAHKYGLTSNLPNNHPYKTIIP